MKELKITTRFIIFCTCCGLAFCESIFWEDGCVEVGSSLPDNLSNLVLDLLSLLSVIFTALARSQSLTRLHMPVFRVIWPTILTAILAFLLWIGSTAILFEDIFSSSSPQSTSCDAKRVVWAVTPIAIGSASFGTLLLTCVASIDAKIRAAIVKRKTLKRQFQFSISAADSYGNGAVAVRNLCLQIVMHATWGIALTISFFFALRGDVLNGLLSMAGIVAVWSNTLLPEWNVSVLGGGQDTQSKNMPGHEFVEINVIGENYDQICVLIQPTHAPKDYVSPLGLTKFVTARMYALANAHAAATDFKDMAFKPETYRPAVDDARKLADVIIEQTELVTSRLSVELKNLNVRDALHRLAFTALVTSILDSKPWSDKPNQRTRIQALAIAEAWLYKFVSASGMKAKKERTHGIRVINILRVCVRFIDGALWLS